ncbi:hypothetical protein AgCh_000868 [Apium graveolens]
MFSVDWAEANNLSGDFKSLCENGKARKYMLEELNSLGRKKKLRDSEMLRAVHLEPTPFDIERDLVTPTFNLKRPQLLKHYKICIYLTNVTKAPLRQSPSGTYDFVTLTMMVNASGS